MEQRPDDEWHWGRAFAALAVVVIGFALLGFPQSRIVGLVILAVFWCIFWVAAGDQWYPRYWIWDRRYWFGCPDKEPQRDRETHEH